MQGMLEKWSCGRVEDWKGGKVEKWKGLGFVHVNTMDYRLKLCNNVLNFHLRQLSTSASRGYFSDSRLFTHDYFADCFCLLLAFIMRYAIFV